MPPFQQTPPVGNAERRYLYVLQRPPRYKYDCGFYFAALLGCLRKMQQSLWKTEHSVVCRGKAVVIFTKDIALA